MISFSVFIYLVNKYDGLKWAGETHANINHRKKPTPLFSLSQTSYLVIPKDNFIINADDWPKTYVPLLYYYFMLKAKRMPEITPWPRKFIKMLNEGVVKPSHIIPSYLIIT